MMSLIYLKVLVTYKCSSRCRHCLFCCSPKAGGRLNVSDFSVWLDKILRDNAIQIFEIQGGEPMLYPEQVRTLARLAKERQIPERWVTTNCSWAVDPKIALTEVKLLHEAGVNRLNFSTDAFHAEFISIDQVRSSIKAAEQIGVQYRLFAAFLGSPATINRYNEQTRAILQSISSEWEQKTDCFSIMFGGRANAELLGLYEEGRGIPQEVCNDMICAATGNPRNPHGLEVDPFGNILIADGIIIGNAIETPISEILSEYDVQNHPIMRVLTAEGPIGLTRLPEAKGFVLHQGYVDRHQLCYEIKKYLRSHFPKILGPQIRYNA